jgi:hypothetical protein
MNINQKRQPKGTDVGGQFAPSVNPESTVDLGIAADEPRIIATFRPQEWVHDCAIDIDGEYEFDVTDALAGLSDEELLAIEDHNYETDALWQNHPIRIEQPHDGPFEVEVADSIKGFIAAKNPVNHETGTFTLGDHTYQFDKTGPKNGVTNYVLVNEEGGGGWRFEYDDLTLRVKAHGVRPVNPSAEWRDKGEADIRLLVRLFEPNTRLIDLDGDTYLIGGDPWPLSKSHLSGISTGEMMLTGGKFDANGLRDYVAQQRRDTDKSEAERPDMADSFAETTRYLDGIEIAAYLGVEAAEANTVAAMRERGL